LFVKTRNSFFVYSPKIAKQELNNLGALREDKRKLGIKLCADGINVGKNIFLVNFCYTLILSKDINHRLEISQLWSLKSRNNMGL